MSSFDRPAAGKRAGEPFTRAKNRPRKRLPSRAAGACSCHASYRRECQAQTAFANLLLTLLLEQCCLNLFLQEDREEQQRVVGGPSQRHGIICRPAQQDILL